MHPCSSWGWKPFRSTDQTVLCITSVGACAFGQSWQPSARCEDIPALARHGILAPRGQRSWRHCSQRRLRIRGEQCRPTRGRRVVAQSRFTETPRLPTITSPAVGMRPRTHATHPTCHPLGIPLYSIIQLRRRKRKRKMRHSLEPAARRPAEASWGPSGDGRHEEHDRTVPPDGMPLPGPGAGLRAPRPRSWRGRLLTAEPP